MAKGDIIKNTFMEYTDEYTGKHVTRLTSEDNLNHHPYFYNKMITNDNRFLIYASRREGMRSLYKMDLTDGTAVQLTDKAGVRDFSSNLTSDDKYMIYVRNDSIIKMNMNTLNEEIIYETPEGWTGGGPSISSDDRFAVIVEMNNRDRIEPKGGWAHFQPQWERRPHCRIVYIDTYSGKSCIVCEENCWLGHPQIRPGDNNTILFCHEGPWTLVERLWLINVDGAGLRCARPRILNESIGHEYWLSDGSRFVFVHFTDISKVNPTIRMIDPDTLKEETLVKCSAYGHCISNRDNTRIVADSKRGDEPFVYMVDVKERREEKLCWHGSRLNFYGEGNQDAHVHPAFSPDGSMVVFTSDREGLPCIYKVDLSC